MNILFQYRSALLALLLSMFFLSTVQAQNELDKFAGKWQWKGNNGEELNLTIKKVCFTYPIDKTKECDWIFVWHEYKVNGKVLENTLPYITTSATIDTKNFGVARLDYLNGKTISNVLSMTISDKIKGKAGEVTFTYQQTTERVKVPPLGVFKNVVTTTAKWSLRDLEGVKLKIVKGFTYPIEAVFTKIE